MNARVALTGKIRKELQPRVLGVCIAAVIGATRYSDCEGELDGVQEILSEKGVLTC